MSLRGRTSAVCFCFVNRDYERASGRQVSRRGDCLRRPARARSALPTLTPSFSRSTPPFCHRTSSALPAPCCLHGLKFAVTDRASRPERRRCFLFSDLFTKSTKNTSDSNFAPSSRSPWKTEWKETLVKQTHRKFDGSQRRSSSSAAFERRWMNVCVNLEALLYTTKQKLNSSLNEAVALIVSTLEVMQRQE